MLADRPAHQIRADIVEPDARDKREHGHAAPEGAQIHAHHEQAGKGHAHVHRTEHRQAQIDDPRLRPAYVPQDKREQENGSNDDDSGQTEEEGHDGKCRRGSDTQPFVHQLVIALHHPIELESAHARDRSQVRHRGDIAQEDARRSDHEVNEARHGTDPQVGFLLALLALGCGAAAPLWLLGNGPICPFVEIQDRGMGCGILFLGIYHAFPTPPKRLSRPWKPRSARKNSYLSKSGHSTSVT